MVVADDDEVTRAIVGQYTRERRCDEDCPVMDCREASSVYDMLRGNLSKFRGRIGDQVLVWTVLRVQRQTRCVGVVATIQALFTRDSVTPQTIC